MARRRTRLERRLKAFGRDWLVPGALGLGGAALLIAGLEQGGWVARATLTLAWVGLAATVAWMFRVIRDAAEDAAAWPDALDDEPDQPADP